MSNNNSYRNGNFKCDKNSKDYFISQIIDYVNATTPEWTVSWYGVNTIGNRDITGFEKVQLGTEDRTSRTDLIMELRKGSRVKSYMIELKERWEKYDSDSLGCKGQEGWIYNIDKDRVLRFAATQGYIPLYVNVYKDGIVRIWNILKVKHIEEVEKPIKLQNVVENSPRVPQKRYMIWNDEATAIKDGKKIERKDIDVW